MSAFSRFRDDMKGKRVCVLGIGISNTPLIKLLVSCGAYVTACDKKSKEQLGELAAELESMGAVLKLGEDYLNDIDGDFVFRTPGINLFRPELVAARERGVNITSEMEAFMKVCPCRMIGITGSDGKTTTSTLISEILKASGYTVHLGGNIGKPLLNEAGSMREYDIAVLELSSFQLMGMDISPDIGVITNISPNHLDIHRDMEEYFDAKMNIFRHQNRGLAVLNAGDCYTERALAECEGKVALFGWKRPEIPAKRLVYFENGQIVCEDMAGKRAILDVRDVRIPGRHNVENFMCAIAAILDMASPMAIRKVAREFSGVEHRIEFIREFNGANYYNDSIASSPTRTIAGLHSFNERLLLIAGGYDKNIPFDGLGVEIADHVKRLYLTGDTAAKIREAVEKAPNFDPGMTAIIDCEGMADAVKRAAEDACQGDVVILSPACASFDAYKNFEQRGEHFKELVHGL